MFFEMLKANGTQRVSELRRQYDLDLSALPVEITVIGSPV